jgi:cytoskeletal protein RodZ
MPESFGARLREQREARQIDLVAISEQTKIKLALLEALEHDDVSHWPSGIFRRAYIRAYAQFIGLDPDVTLREFLDLHPDPADLNPTTAAGAAAAEEQYAKQGASLRFRSIVGSALGSLTRLRKPALDVRQPAPVSAAPAATLELDEVPGEAEAAWASTSSELGCELHHATAVPLDTAADMGVVLEAEPPAPAPVDESARVEQAEEPAPASSVEIPAEPAQPAQPAATPRSPIEPRVEHSQPAAAGPAETEPLQHYEMLERVALLCTEFGRVIERDAVRRLLQESAAVLNAAGLIVWLADESGEALRPGLVHGYSEKLLAHLPAVTRDDDNATAAAFRSSACCEVAGDHRTPGALVVPMLIPAGCAGVFAVELQQGVKPDRAIRAAAVLLAAALTQLLHRSRPAERTAPVERPAPAVAQFPPAARPMKVRR